MRTILASLLLLTSTRLMAQDKPELGNNIFTITPMTIISNEPMDNNTDVAVGINYERIVSDGLIGIQLPVNLSLRNPGFFYFMPAIKLYPTRQGVVRYAVGPQFYFAGGQIEHSRTESVWNGNQYIYTRYKHSDNHTQLGFMINNSLNVTIAKTLYLGMDLGIGISYFDSAIEDEENDNDSFDTTPVSPSVKFSFAMGYRF